MRAAQQLANQRLGAIAGGLCGALRGPRIFPPAWIAQVNAATKADPYTNNHRTIEETADGLHAAFLAKQKRLAGYVASMAGSA